MQLRDDKAHAFAADIQGQTNWSGELALGCINSLRFVVPLKTEVIKAEWKTMSIWERFAGLWKSPEHRAKQQIPRRNTAMALERVA